MVKFLFFAQLAEQAQCDFIELPYEQGKTTRDYLSAMELKLPAELLATLRHDVVMLSINQMLASWDDELNDDDEVGLLPPFSGG